MILQQKQRCGQMGQLGQFFRILFIYTFTHDLIFSLYMYIVFFCPNCPICPSHISINLYPIEKYRYYYKRGGV